MEEGSMKASLMWRFMAIFALHAVAIFLFTRGFLLTRTELSAFSACSDASASPCSSPPTGSGGDGSQCWTKPAVDKVVIIIFDALRFDFVAPRAFFEETRPWMDRLKVLQKLAAEEPTSARIFKAIADPPTTTLQRLKGLTTGGLPTFIDVGNSFGAPAIVEDNLIHQLVKNGKRILMMGDDTWLQLFPKHFQKCFPFPSFNVKDLHTVDNGCVDHLFPSLHLDEWDVLIAHFLGVDHAGHIFGVDTSPMMEKLEQYNIILENVVETLKNLSSPGGLHENTLLLVMGDHGQTLNGDHGGGTPEEVETALFAMSLKRPHPSILSIFDESSCKSSEDGHEICVSTFQQLDFAATVAALIGIPFPFGSIGRVNPELYALGAGTWKGASTNSESCSQLEAWMQNYIDVLCLNCWQVKKYIDHYSASSVIGFPKGDLVAVEDMFANVQNDYTYYRERSFFDKESDREFRENNSAILKWQVGSYSNFLDRVAELARSKWTEFDLREMGAGLFTLLLSIIFHLFSVRGIKVHFLKHGLPYDQSGIFPIFAALVVVIRAFSALSNSYILTEGKVAVFLLATTGIFVARFAFVKRKYRTEAVTFLFLNFLIGFGAKNGPLKESVMSTPLISIWTYIQGIGSVLFLVTLSIILYKAFPKDSSWSSLRHIILGGTVLSYILIAIHWAMESNVLSLALVIEVMGRNFIPRMIYVIAIGMLVMLVFYKSFLEGVDICSFGERSFLATVCMLSVWSPMLIFLLGTQGSFVVLAFVLKVWCITRLQNVTYETTNSNRIGPFVDNSLSVVQLSLLAVCLFFYSGHWCAFDGLRYGAAFIGFDEFNLIRQGILLAIDTFGFSHILPIFSLPILVVFQNPVRLGSQSKTAFYYKLTEVYLIYGLATAVTTTLTIICVTIHRRHLMVWGLFAPKFVFDAVGLLLTDILICFASFYYF